MGNDPLDCWVLNAIDQRIGLHIDAGGTGGQVGPDERC